MNFLENVHHRSKAAFSVNAEDLKVLLELRKCSLNSQDNLRVNGIFQGEDLY